MNVEDSALNFLCHDAWLYGILSLPEQARARGILIVVGGPQYRTGSHRQFTLMARFFASHGIPVMRFDYRGMGDSDGDVRNFEHVDGDLRCAIDHFTQVVPGLTEVVILGLCDAASAALFYAYQDQRVTGMVLINPWVRTEAGIAKAYLKHYYLRRFLDLDLWKKVIVGRLNYVKTIRSFSKMLMSVFVRRREPETVTLPDRMHDGLRRFKGKVLLILCGNDLTAMEFSDLVQRAEKWQASLGSEQVTRHDLPNANHTFSQRDWRDQITTWIKDWMQAW